MAAEPFEEGRHVRRELMAHGPVSRVLMVDRPGSSLEQPDCRFGDPRQLRTRRGQQPAAACIGDDGVHDDRRLLAGHEFGESHGG